MATKKKNSSTSSRKAPWNKPRPRKTKKTKLSSSSKASAKRTAKKAGRSYPSLVDNMNAAKAQKKRAKGGAKKKTSSK